MKKTSTAIALAMLALGATGAQAAAGDILVRVRAIMVAPNEKNSAITVAGAPYAPLAGAKLSVNDDVVPEIDFTYMFTNNIGAELIAATSLHKVSLGALPIASTYALPPTLTLQYHFNPEGGIRPYVGAGINYTFFYQTKTKTAFRDFFDGALSVPTTNAVSSKVRDSFGWAAQAGVDIDLTKKFFLNLDVKYISMKAKYSAVSAGAPGAPLRTNVDLNPLVIGVGFGTRF